MMKFKLIAGLAAVALTGIAAAQNNANWKLLEKYNSGSMRRFVYSSSVTPRWINKTDRFWYVWNEAAGKRFMIVNPAKRTKEHLFDHDKLAASLSELGKKPYVGSQLPFNSVKWTEEEDVIRFAVGKVNYEWHLADETLKTYDPKDDEKEEEPELTPQQRFRQRQGGGGGPSVSFAPDKLQFAYSQGWNLYVGSREKEEDKIDKIEGTQLTEDGEQFFGFTSFNYRSFKDGDKQEKKTRVGATWSKDSEAFAITRSDARKVKSLFVINVLSNPRPTLEEYKYQMPGEENVETYELYVYNDEKLTMVPTAKWKDQQVYNIHWTGEDHDVLRFVRRDRLQRNLDFCEYNLESGEVKVLFSEEVEDAHIERKNVSYVGEDNTGDMIWWSERTGWGHYYLYSHDGELKNAITSGAWRAHSMAAVDREAERFYFSGVGRESDQNIYNSHYYSVGLDGKDLRHLTEGDANHSIAFADSKKFSVNTYSRPDMEPSVVVRDDRGLAIMELETMDLSRLDEVGWKKPERFTVKSADGVTDIYGNMWKPYDFNPSKQYPIILYVYPGPQTEAVTNSFRATSSRQDLAQLGFIVVEIGNRGGTPARSNAYHSYGYYNLRDYGLADKKAGVEQLAGRHDFIDIDRVGIYGHSGGGFMTGAAMLLPPYNKFFKVGVSSAGNHDNNIYNANWSEQHHGLKIKEEKKDEKKKEEGKEGDKKKDEDKDEKKEETKFEIRVPTTVELAKNLEGKLLIVHGDIDNNVHPGNSVRLADALIKAGKRFDFMIMPGQRHGFGSMNGYFTNMLREYFARHLLGDTYDSSAEMEDKGG